tara:strand:+ start:1704 stop:1820 length:117 start_codon:yes stop_codon:yes gene_type:complete
MIEDLPNALAALFITTFAAWFAWESTMVVDEQKRKRRK